MKTPQFRLATLLTLRQAVRNERRGQLAEAFRAAEAVQAQLNDIEREIDSLKKQICSAPGAVDVQRMVDTSRYEAVLRAEKKRVEQPHSALAIEVEKRRQALLAADRDVRALEQLREQQAWRQRESLQRQDSKETDELTAGRTEVLRVA